MADQEASNGPFDGQRDLCETWMVDDENYEGPMYRGKTIALCRIDTFIADFRLHVIDPDEWTNDQHTHILDVLTLMHHLVPERLTKKNTNSWSKTK